MKPRRAEGVIELALGSETVLFVEASNNAVACDSVARRVWELSDGERNLLEIAQTLSIETRQALTRVLQDVEEVVRRLMDERALVAAAPGPAETWARPIENDPGSFVVGFEDDRVIVRSPEPWVLERARLRLGALEVPADRRADVASLGLLEIVRRRRHYELLGDGLPFYVCATLDQVVRALEDEVVRRLLHRRQDLAWFHAGAAARGSRAVVFAGAAGRGKSTLVAGLCRHGWRYLSDEFVAIAPATLEVLPFPRTPIVRQSSPRELSEREARVMRRSEVQVEQGSICTTRVELGAIVFPRYLHGDGARLEPVSRSSAALQLLENCRSFGRSGESTVRAIVTVAGSLPLFSLVYGSAEEAVDLVQRASPHWWLD